MDDILHRSAEGQQVLPCQTDYRGEVRPNGQQMVPARLHWGVGHKAENTALEEAVIVTENRTFDIPDHQDTLTHSHAVSCFSFCHDAEAGKTQTIKSLMGLGKENFSTD